jgi:hypothetical protein
MRNQQPSHGNQAQASKFAQADDAPQTGDCLATPLDASGVVYTDEQVASLLFMIEEEKLAGDLYEAFYDQTGLLVFDRIASAEDRHMDALVNQAELAGLDIDGILALPAGEYLNPELQALYVDLLVAGSVSADAALAVGQQVEQADIADLTETMITVVGTPLEIVYSHLETGSTHHLAAFDSWLAA